MNLINLLIHIKLEYVLIEYGGSITRVLNVIK